MAAVSNPNHDPARSNILTYALQLGQLALLLLVAKMYLIEQTYGLTTLLPLIFAAFAVHSLLPGRLRGPFFVLLFPAASVLLLGFVPALAVLSGAALLFLLCHLPVPIFIRGAILVSVGILLAAVRLGALEIADPTIQSYIQTQTLPIIGAIFMFRTAIYLYDLRHEKKAVSIWQRLGYFFLFPNLCFPLFPVIDYQTFKRTYYDRDSQEIYQKGIDWIFRGITHLLLYRVVYHYFVPDTLAIQNLAGVAQYALSSFLLYLRISGLFHLIVGILCLFGYNLPETHHRYYLSESFTDFWRRINIYWKDFMVKMFYYPIFMSLRKLGMTSAMILATLITFVITWALHSYQWFWLRGSFPIVPQDVIFWGTLAILVTANSLYEEKFGRKRRSLKRDARPSRREAFVRSFKTVVVFTTICILWSFWTSASVQEWLAVMSVAGEASAGEWLVALAVFILAIIVGALIQMMPGRASAKAVSNRMLVPLRTAWVGAASVAALALGTGSVSARISPGVSEVVATISGEQLNRRDQQQLVKGYYEELLGTESSGSMAWSVRLEQPEDWRWNGGSQTEYTRDLGDIRGETFLPSISTIDKGQEFSTNSWGMRDDEYRAEKPEDTIRIAMVGSSHSVGAGVEMEQTFPALLERRLSDYYERAHGLKVEILNFSHAGDSILRRAERFRRDALPFEPDVVVDMAITGEEHLAVRNLRIAIRNGLQEMDPFLQRIVDETDVSADLSSEEIEARLGAYRTELVAWGYRYLAESAMRNDVQALVFLLPKISDADSAYEEEWQTLSPIWAEAGLTAVHIGDVYGPLNHRNDYKLAPWDWHPNAQGHALIAERLLKELSVFELNAGTSVAASPDVAPTYD